MNLFKKIFGEKPLKEPLELGQLKTDMHSHLIPAIDDGVTSLEESVELIKQFSELGYKKLITTPHIMTDYYKNTPEIIKSGLDEVKKAIAKQKISIQLDVAAEYLLDDGFFEKMKSGKLMTFGKNYLLVELSYFTPPQNLKQMIFDIQLAGYKIVLAHPERYVYWHDNMDDYEDLVNRGLLLQLNMISLCGYYSDDVRKVAEKLVDREMISFVASDCHNQHYIDALKDSRYERYLEKLMNSNKLLNNKL